MAWLRPVLAALFGLAIAPAAGLVVLTVLVLLDPVTRRAASAAGDVVLELMGEAAFDPSAAEELDAAFVFLYAAIVAIGFLPILVVAGLGTLTKLESSAYYAAATGAVTTAMPWLLRSAFHLPRTGPAGPTEARVVVALFLTGVVIGWVYWLVTTTFGGMRGNSAS